MPGTQRWARLECDGGCAGVEAALVASVVAAWGGGGVVVELE